ncbi:MAG: PilZ domain-containing protein [Moraxellaceae bacterium]|nr:MAG: PilZ domain-containing protein [Moraxellaceae bacterium]
MTILHSVWQKLAGKNASSLDAGMAKFMAALKSDGPDSSASASDSADFVPEEYLSLWKLQSQRQILEIKVEGTSRSYQTIIMAIDTQRGFLWLDDLFPTQHVLELGDNVTLRHHRNGEQLCFTSPVVAWGSTYGATGLAILLPEQVSYQPRRQNIRCDLSNAPTLSVKIRPMGQDISYGTVQDISLAGLRMMIPGNLLGQLHHGAFLPLCELALSDELQIRCSARVRSLRMERTPHRHTQVSVEFIDLPLDRQQKLQQFLNNLNYLQQTADIRQSA